MLEFAGYALDSKYDVVLGAHEGRHNRLYMSFKYVFQAGACFIDRVNREYMGLLEMVEIHNLGVPLLDCT